MIELPEALNLAKQINKELKGKTIKKILPPTKPHKFCWFMGDPADYEKSVAGGSIIDATGLGIWVEISISGGMFLSFNDGVNVRMLPYESLPSNYQLAIIFTDDTALVFTVSMYGSIVLHDGSFDNEYYIKSKQAVSPFSNDFSDYFRGKMLDSKQSLSAKAFLATEQRFPGIGNGALQDILFEAGIHPKTKIGTLQEDERDNLLLKTINILEQITKQGGRDTEKDLYGNPGGYKTKMSKNTVGTSCQVCGSEIEKATYLGGAIYYCPCCQKCK